MKLFTIATFLIVSSAAKGQLYWGGQTGISQNSLQTNIQNRPQQAYKEGYGLYAGLPLLFQWNCDLFADGKLSVIQKSYALDRTDSLSSLNQYIRNDYGQLQVDVGYRYTIRANGVTGKYSLYVAGGLFGAYWIDSHIEGAVPNLLNTAAPYPQASTYSEAYSFDSRRDKRFEWGWQAGGVSHTPCQDMHQFLSTQSAISR
jgi:hypothetical protein